MKTQKWTVFLCFLLFMVLGSCNQSSDDSAAIAVVGDESLTLNSLMRDLPRHVRPNLSSVDVRASVIEWINEEVLYQEALAMKLDEDPGLEREFEQLKKELIVGRLLERTLREEIPVTEEEITAYYEANKDGYVVPDDMVHAYHILLSNRDAANDIRSKLRDGVPFEQVVHEANNDTLASIDWDWGYFTQNDVIPDIAKVVFKMSPNTYSTPVQSDLGYHVFQVVDKLKKGDTKSLEMVREEIRMKLQEKKKQDKYQRYLLQMKSKFKIQTNFQLLDTVVLDSLLNEGA